MVRDTSIEAYKEIIEEGLVCKKQAEIIYFLFDNPNSTDKEISVGTGMSINCVTGRRNELADLGLVMDTGKRICTVTKRNVYQWDLTSQTNKDKIRQLKNIKPNKKCPFCQGRGML